MPTIDLTLVHAPAVYDFRERSIMYGPVSDMVPSTPIFEMYPLGFTTIGEYLERHNIHVRLYNLAGLMLHKKGFNVEKNLTALHTHAFGIDLHWMPHCHGSIEVARILKRLHPHTPIIFGGLSATIFHEELIAYDCVDYVLRGDSTEEPFRRLMERILRAKKTGSALGDLSDIPNLTWKDASGRPQTNPLNWIPSTMDAISLDYAYPMKGVIRHRDMLSYVPFKSWLNNPVCASLTSRGCNRDCATCGGSHTAYRKHFGRDKIAWRDPALLVRDIETIQKHIWGPIFVLNDFLQAGYDYAEKLITGLRGKLANPIGFEFFGPPKEGRDFYELLNRNLPQWSIEISAESHDDAVRTAFGKGHYRSEQLEETIIDALDAGCQRFDLYFMTGIPTQTKESVLETGDYVRHLYERVGFDPRLTVFISPMAPFLDVGSRAFDDASTHGYTLLARTLAEHRERMVLPSWKHIMNYESHSMTTDEMVEATYAAALDINRVKGSHGVIAPDIAARNDVRIRDARDQMARLDQMLQASTTPLDETLRGLKQEFERLSESTVAEKSELNWPYRIRPAHLANNARLWAGQFANNARAALTGTWASIPSDFSYPEQENGENPPAEPSA
ncbi:MAG: TIGR04190 family B12-binding domain/radical SAM domain protein [Coriobacteriales bacterium]|nr:TIGR04190 family B12-binding domain/radical SAM domain protein [Coriobacteriales bacterium]